MPRTVHGARTDERRRAGLFAPLSLAGLCLVGLALVWVVAELVPAVHARDGVLLEHFLALQSHGTVNSVAEVLPQLLNPVAYTVFAIGLVLVAVSRERPRLALAVAAILVLGPLSAELLKPLLAHSHVRVGFTRIGAASYPSGHSTSAAVLAIGAVLVSPRRLKPVVGGVALLFTLAIGASLLIRFWHMPSDVLGGYLLALLWGSLAVAAVRGSALRRARRGAPSP